MNTRGQQIRGGLNATGFGGGAASPRPKETHAMECYSARHVVSISHVI
jgi:hypothetical protein